MRPTSMELLQSDYLPPPQVEEAELHEMVKHTLASRNSKSYRHLVDSCLGQTMDIKNDIIYDLDVQELPNRFFVKQEYVRRRIQKVFEKHGAVQVAVPQLAPKGQSLMNIYEKSETVKSEIVKAMTRSGNVVYLPFDLRVPFAR